MTFTSFEVYLNILVYFLTLTFPQANTSEANTNTTNTKKLNASNKVDNQNSNNKQGYSTKAAEVFSKSDDQTLLRLKHVGTSWKNILTELGKESLTQVKEHYKELENKGIVTKYREEHGGEKKDEDKSGGNGNNDKKGKDKSGKANSDKPKTNEQIADNNDKQSKKQRKADRKAAKSQTNDSPTTPKVSFATPLESLTPDGLAKSEDKSKPKEKMTEDEIKHDMRKFAYAWDDNKWTAVASRYYDVSGKRVDGVEARRLFD